MATIRHHYTPALTIWLTAKQTGKSEIMILRRSDPSGLLTCVSPGHLKYSTASVRSPHHTQTRAHTHRSITSNSLDTQLMAKGPFKVAHLSPAHSPHTHNALFMAPWLTIKPACVSSWLQDLQGLIHFMPERSLHPLLPSPSFSSTRGLVLSTAPWQTTSALSRLKCF